MLPVFRCLPRASASRYIPHHPLIYSSIRTMSSSPDAFLVPIDPSAPASNEVKQIADLWNKSRPKDKAGESRLFFDVDGKGSLAVAVSLGPKSTGKSELVRKAVGGGIKKLRDAGATTVLVDAKDQHHAAAEGAHLGLFKFNHLKTGKNDAVPSVTILPPTSASSAAGELNWETGTTYAQAQNLARELMELPANMLTPTKFCERVAKEFKGVKNVELIVRDKAWAEEKGMRTFLSVTHGTSEPPKFLEIHYKGASDPNAQPLVFVGKGITFDSGGISLKPGAGMKLMRGDMGGAATVVSATLAIAKLGIPINLITLTPLTENMPGPSATKPGDVVYAMNGKSVEVDNTDAEGRLVLSDALWYGSTEFKPHTVVDCATLTGAMVIALGEIYSGVFSTSDSLWEELHAAGQAETDPFWRMPLDEGYGFQIYSSNADLCNTGGRPAGSCTAALFLKSFVNGIEAEEGKEPAVRWAHVDIAGSMEATRGGVYQEKGMTGRPVRAFVEFARRLGGGKV